MTLRCVFLAKSIAELLSFSSSNIFPLTHNFICQAFFFQKSVNHDLPIKQLALPLGLVLYSFLCLNNSYDEESAKYDEESVVSEDSTADFYGLFLRIYNVFMKFRH